MKENYYEALGLVQWEHRTSGDIEEVLDTRVPAGLMIVSDGDLIDGPAAQLLTAMLNAINLQRDDVLIVDAISFELQMSAIKPALLLAMGDAAVNQLLQMKDNIASLRNKMYHYGVDQIPLMVSYHPAHLVAHPADKRQAWEDLQVVRKILSPSVG